MPPSLLVIMRHAESVSQVARQGIFVSPDKVRSMHRRSDRSVPLTDSGLRAAKEAGRRLKDKFGVWDAILCPNYVRHVQTLDGIRLSYTREEWGRTAILATSLLNERSMGDLFSLTESEARRLYPKFFEHLEAVDEIRLTFPGGDSLLTVRARCVRLLSMLEQNYSGKRILALTSWGPIMCLRALLEGWTDDEMLMRMAMEHPCNCSVTVYEPDKERNKLVLREACVQL